MNQTCENIGVLPSSLNLNKRVYFTIKRLFDIIFGLIGCILLVPLTLIVKLVYVLSGDFNSIFYKQKRIGKNGNQFYMYKFRTMVPNADKILTDLLKQPEYKKEYKINKKLFNDPRVTRIGSLLRTTSIDEIPQLFNVLKGDMSLIGNRPYLPREIVDMGYYLNDIVKTKPGLTGYWQCTLRSRGTFNDRLKMEEYYSNNENFIFDLKIFIRTIKAVWTHEGAK